MDKENNVYKDSNLEIRDNILKFNDHVIQLSNISSVSVSPMEKQKIPNELYLGILVGLVCFAIMPPVGLIIAGAALFIIFKIIFSFFMMIFMINYISLNYLPCLFIISIIHALFTKLNIIIKSIF